MNRAERRRIKREAVKEVTKTYNLTEYQLKEVIREGVAKELDFIKARTKQDAVNEALVLLFALPLKVLMEHYWKKSYVKKLPEFTEKLLDLYEQWQLGKLEMEDLQRDLWEYGGIKLEEAPRLDEN